MPRAVKGAARRRAKNRVLKEVKGFWGGRSKLYRTAKESIKRKLQFAYRDRRTRRRDLRRLWIQRISAACRMRDIRYSQFIAGLVAAGVVLDRKVLSDMAISDPAGFDHVVAVAKDALAAKV